MKKLILRFLEIWINIQSRKNEAEAPLPPVRASHPGRVRGRSPPFALSRSGYSEGYELYCNMKSVLQLYNLGARPLKLCGSVKVEPPRVHLIFSAVAFGGAFLSCHGTSSLEDE